MTDLETLKKAFDEIGVHYKETKDHEEDWTYISPCNERHKHKPVNLYVDNFYEFDENGSLASY